MLNTLSIAEFGANLFTRVGKIDSSIDMEKPRRFGMVLLAAFLSLTLASVGSASVIVTAQPGPPYSPPYPFPPTFPVNEFDFTITSSTTLVKIQQGQTGGLVIWVTPFCPNSTTTIKCDSTVLQTVYLSISGCPGGAFCALSRQVVNIPPDYQGASNFIIYTFFTITPSNSPTLITVTGTNQFGVTHSTTFGAIVCYC